MGVWQRFTEAARKAVYYAQYDAGRFGHKYVTTEHLLLGLLHEDGSHAVRVIALLGAVPSRIRSDIEAQMLRAGPVSPEEDIQLSVPGKRVIDLAIDESRLRGLDYIDSEHLLVGLIREGDGLAARSLTFSGITLEVVRQQIQAIYAERASAAGSPSAEGEQEKA
jgi:ATP-dependent Clp protease ATP-binding subunit ClpC